MVLSQGVPPSAVSVFWLSQGLGDMPLAFSARKHNKFPITHRRPTDPISPPIRMAIIKKNTPEINKRAGKDVEK